MVWRQEFVAFLYESLPTPRGTKERGETLVKHSTDVLIIGGGIIGCALAYFLCKQGIEVIVLEEMAAFAV